MILHGDSLEVLRTLDANSVDAVVTDPPYGTTACKWDVVVPFEPLWAELHRVCKPNAAICIFGSEPFASRLRTSNLGNFRFDWVWLKSNGGGFLNANRAPLKRHETVSVFSRKAPNYFPQKTPGKAYRCTSASAGETTQDQSVAGWVTENKGDRFPLSYQRFKSETGYHPTQKPVALCEYLLKSHCPPGGLVLDPFAGSGSTGVAAKRLGFRFLGIERELEYCKIAQKRLEAA